MKPLSTNYALAMVSPRHALTFPDTHDRDAFFTDIDADERDAVKELHDAMMQIVGAKNPNQGSKAVAAKHPSRNGWSWQRLRAIYDEWEGAGRDWRWLVDKRRYPEAREAMLDPRTKQWVVEQLLRNQRAYAPMIRDVQGQWRQWWRTGNDKYAIPGFVDADGHPKCPAPDAGRLPYQLQDHNLRRVSVTIAPATVEMVRYGTHAARKLLMKIPGTREGLRWLEWVSGDDVELDVGQHVNGFGKCRTLQFGFWERSCSVYLADAFIQRPRTPSNAGTGPDGRSWEKLKRRDFLFCVALMIERYGWPMDYVMHLLVENGTATMSQAQAQWLYEISEGQIVIGWSSMEGEFIAAWEERRAGNSNAKGGHEGYHGILKNEMGHLRGQLGKDRDHAPAIEYGREKVAARLDNVIVQLPPEERGRIITPHLSRQQIFRETYDAMMRIHHKKEHDCEGFEEVVEWRPKGLMIEPLPLEALEEFARQNPRVNDDNVNEFVEWFPRVETRAERQRRLSAQGRFMAPPPAAMVPFYEDNCVMKKIGADHSFRFEVDGRRLAFIPSCPEFALMPGDSVVGFYRPDEQVMHLFTGRDKNRRFLVTYVNEGKLRHDADAATRAQFFKRKHAFFDHTYAEVAKATQEQVALVRAEAEHNEMVMHENGILSANVQRACTSSATAVLGLTEERQQFAKASTRQAKAATDAEKQGKRDRLAAQAAAARAAREAVSA